MHLRPKHRYLILALLITTLFTYANIRLIGAPGLFIFLLADFIWSLLVPKFHGDYLLDIGVRFGVVWPISMAVVFYVTCLKDGNQNSKVVRIRQYLKRSVVVTLLLALMFHLYAFERTRNLYGDISVNKVQIGIH